MLGQGHGKNKIHAVGFSGEGDGSSRLFGVLPTQDTNRKELPVAHSRQRHAHGDNGTCSAPLPELWTGSRGSHTVSELDVWPAAQRAGGATEVFWTLSV